MSDLLNTVRAQAEVEGDTETLEALSNMSELQANLMVGVVEAIGSGMSDLLGPLAQANAVSQEQVVNAIAKSAQNVILTMLTLGAGLPQEEAE